MEKQNLFPVDVYRKPLDLILSMVESRELDIYEIDLATLTDKYIEEIKKLDIDIESLSKYAYISSILLKIKTSGLIETEDNECENLTEILKESLIEYKKYKEVSTKLKQLETESLKRYKKKPEQINFYEEIEETFEISNDIQLLRDIFADVYRSFDEKEKVITIENSEPDLNIYKRHIILQLKNGSISINDITKEIKNKIDCIAYFLSLLELVRLQKIIIKQKAINHLEVIRI